MRLIGSALMAAVVLTAPGLTVLAQTFRAGAGHSDIQTSPAMFPVAEFSALHDSASARVLLLDDGTNRIALLTVDTPSIQEPSVVRWKAILNRVASVQGENALVIGTHDTSSPHISATGAPVGLSAEAHGMAPKASLGPPLGGGAPLTAAQIAHGKAYAKAVDDAVAAAAAQAAAVLKPAEVGFGRGISRVNISSQLLTPKGWTNGLNDEGETDPSLAIIRFSSLDGKPLAWLMDYAVRPAVMERSRTASGGALISGDLIGAARHLLETQYGSGTTAIFLMGAASDQQPLFTAVHSVFDKDGNSSRVDIHEAGFTLVDLLGERLGSDAVRVNQAIHGSTAPTKLRLERHSMLVAMQTSLQPESAASAAGSPTSQKAEIPYVLLQIGDIVIVGVKHELNAVTGEMIRRESPFAQTVVATMVEGSNGGLPDVSVYDRGIGSAVNSLYARGSAEALATAIEARLKALHDASGAGQ